MPTYPINKTYRGGFYHNKVDTSGNNDRVYSAEDIRKPYDVIYTDGVKPEADGEVGENLKVQSVGNMVIAITPGFAKLGGAWFENTGNYNITLDPPTSETRYDCVIVRNDDSDDVREPSIYIKSLNHIPVVSDLTRDANVYEICLAYIPITSSTTSITDSIIKDTRIEGELCNTMSGVGAVVVRTYRNTVFSQTSNQKVVQIGISQYDRTRDTLTVFIEGRVTKAYTINSNSQITLDVALPIIGTRIDFEVSKNVNAAGADTVVSEVAELRTEVTELNNKNKYHYYCNGLTDNANISNIVNTFLSEATDYDSIHLVVHGHFGATSPVTGAGTSASPYVWIRAGSGSATNRRVFLDFRDCEQISINCDDGTYNIIFFGLQANITGASVSASGGESINMFSTAALTFVNVDDCRFWITSNSGYIARGGNFRDCRCSVTTNGSNAYCFNTLKGGLLRIFGGEYYAYAPTSYFSTIIYVNSDQTGAVVTTYSMNCPTNARSGYVQTYAVNCLTGDACCSFTDTISNLSIVATGQNIRGTIEQSKAGLN